jgi:hypothetical protein
MGIYYCKEVLKPRPVPSPAFLVVKKGSNIFSMFLGFIPVPLSEIDIFIESVSSLVSIDIEP